MASCMPWCHAKVTWTLRSCAMETTPLREKGSGFQFIFNSAQWIVELEGVPSLYFVVESVEENLLWSTGGCRLRYSVSPTHPNLVWNIIICTYDDPWWGKLTLTKDKSSLILIVVTLIVVTTYCLCWYCLCWYARCECLCTPLCVSTVLYLIIVVMYRNLTCFC